MQPSAPPAENMYPQLGGGLNSQPYVPQQQQPQYSQPGEGYAPPQPQIVEQKEQGFAPIVQSYAPMQPMQQGNMYDPSFAPGVAVSDAAVPMVGEGMEGEGEGGEGGGAVVVGGEGENGRASIEFFEREIMSNENVDIFLQPEGQIQLVEQIAMIPTLQPIAEAAFQPLTDAKQIKKVLGFFNSAATTQRTLIEILGHRTAAQRQAISGAYSTLYKRQLLRDVTHNGAVRGPFQEIMRGLLEQPAAYQARWLNWALRKNDIRFLILLMCTSTPEELGMVKQAFELEYRSNLVNLIRQQTTQFFGLHTKTVQKFLLSIASEERPPTSFYVDQNQVQIDAQNLKRASEGQDLDKNVFIEIFSHRSLPHIAQVAMVFREIASGTELVDVIKNKFKESSETGYACMVTMYFASRRYDLYTDMFGKALKNPGPQLEFLTRLIVRHCEFDLGNVLNLYGIEKFQFYLRQTHETGHVANQRWVEIVKLLSNVQT